MKVTLRHIYVAHTVQLGAPAYLAFGEWARLATAVHARFRDYGVRPSDIRFDGGQEPSEYQLTCRFAAYTVRFRVLSVGLESFAYAPLPFSPPEVVESAVEVVEALAPGLGIAGHEFILAGHGQLETGSVADFMRRFVRPETGGLRPVAVTLEPMTGSTGRSLTVDLQPSLLFKDTNVGFLRIRLEGGEGESVAAAAAAFNESVRVTMGELDLAPAWEVGVPK